MNSINKNLNETINIKLEDNNISIKKIEEIINKTINKKSKINKSNKDLSKPIDDKATNSINKNLNETMNNKSKDNNISNKKIEEIIDKTINKKVKLISLTKIYQN